MTATQTNVPKVRWSWVRRAVGIMFGIGLLGLTLVAVPILIGNAANNSPGNTVSLTGLPAGLVILGFLLLAAGFFGFLPVVIITALVSRNHRPAPPDTPIAAPPAYQPTPTGAAAPSGEAAQRRARAAWGGNMQGLGSRRSNRLGWIIGTVTFVILGTFFLLSLFSNVDPNTTGLVAVLGFPVVFTVAAIGLAWILWRTLRSKNNDEEKYSTHFRMQSEDIRNWGYTTAVQRQYSEDVEPIGVLGQETNEKIEDFFQQLGETFNTVDIPQATMKSPWAQAMWDRDAEWLLGREVALRYAAERLNSPFTPYIELGGDTPAPAPTVLIDGGRSAVLYQQRNELILEDPEYPVRVVDLVLLSKTSTQQKGQPKEYRPQLQTFTYAETWFPSDHWLHAYPRTLTSINRFGSMGRKIDASARQFNRRYNVQTDSPQWARLVLNPAVMKILVDLAPARFTVDAGRLILHTDNGWLPPQQIVEMAELVRRIARSAQAAEAN